jgi:glycosyltransferase involved in cell wall biosynthesis
MSEAVNLSRPLRIGLNLTFLGSSGGGVGRYASELPGAILELAPETRLELFVARDAPAELRSRPWADRVRWWTFPVPAGGRAATLGQFPVLPLYAAARRLDVLHSPANVGATFTPGRSSVLTLHDLIWLHQAGDWDADPRVRQRMRTLVEQSLRHATRIFTDSHAAAADITRTLEVDPVRIIVVAPGATPPGPPRGRQNELRAKLELQGERVVLCVAQRRGYKNLGVLLRAMPELDDDCVLVLLGPPSDHADELRELAMTLGVHRRVRFIDWLSEDDLSDLYAAATLFALPTLAEGFGLPVVEAMARGIPVACSDIPVLREVGGDAVAFFDPHDQADVTGVLRRLLGDSELRRQLAERGRQQATSFTWRSCAQAALDGYREAIRVHRQPG